MEKARVYLDTSVPSAYFDSRAPDRQRLTRAFWTDRLRDFAGVISHVVLREVEDTPDAERRRELLGLVGEFKVLSLNEEALGLAESYVARGIFPEVYLADALHVAVAVVHRVGYLASWNFAHLVKVQTRREVNLVNALEGYDPIEIVAPPEL